MTGMKARTIKAVLRKKFDSWKDSLPEYLQETVQRDAVITGGCIASMLLGEDVNDYDIYFTTKETTLAVAQYYVDKFLEARKSPSGGVTVPIEVEELDDVRGQPRVRIVVKSAGVESVDRAGTYDYFETRPPEEAQDYVNEVFGAEEAADLYEEMEANLHKSPETWTGYHPVFLSSNAITLSGSVQIIIRFFGEPDELHENYDFTHCTNYWLPNGELALRPAALEALLSKTLVYQGSRYPVASLFRIRKFIERGWKVNAGQIVKIALQISELDLARYEVLEDQLTGVDVAYFNEVLSHFKEGEEIDQAYFVEIIERLFD